MLLILAAVNGMCLSCVPQAFLWSSLMRCRSSLPANRLRACSRSARLAASVPGEHYPQELN